MPVYEDWDSAVRVCAAIDAVASQQPYRFSVLFIDDGSRSGIGPAVASLKPKSLDRISVVRLRRNIGHQRAIAVGLAHLHANSKGDAIVVMDADGEDAAEDIPRLLEHWRSAPAGTTIFAERGRRAEGLSFRFSYLLYRLAHRFVTGRDIRFGNFSVVPWMRLESLVVSPELWNHYAATILKTKLPFEATRLDRGRRLVGDSKMNFVGLVIHGLSALFADQEVVGVRLLLAVFVLGIALSLGIVGALGYRLATSLSIPGWTSTGLGLMLVLLGVALTASAVIIFSIMMNRSNLGFLPIRDAHFFVLGETTLFGNAV